MGISLNQINIYVFIWIIISIIYMLIYRFKGTRQSFEGYFQAIQSCICYGVVSIFVALGIFIVKEIIIQKIYIGLIIPLVWGLIGYSIIKACLKRDFSINIQILKIETNIIERIIRMIILLFFFVVFLFMAGVMVYIAVTEFNGELLRMLIMIMVGIVCIGGGIIVLNDFLNNYTQKRLRINMRMLILIMSILLLLIFILAMFL